MEPISEERQRKVILWANPDLATKDFGLCNGDGAMPRRASWYEGMGQRVNRTKELEPLYVWDKDRNWQPNYQWFFTEAIPKLEAEGVVALLHMGYIKDVGAYSWELYERNGCDALSFSPDPIAALAEYVEVTGEA